MNFSNSLAAQIKALPGGSFVSDTFDRLMHAITAGYTVQHNDDDTHATITATGSVSERGRAVPMGEWIFPTFDATRFTVSGASNTWVVPAPDPGNTFYAVAYTLIGKTMLLNLFIPERSNLTITTAVSALTVMMPPGFRVGGASVDNNTSFIGQKYVGFARIKDDTSIEAGLLIATAGETSFEIWRAAGANFVTDALFAVSGQLILDVEAV